METLPTEIILQITRDLDFRDAKCLRRTSRRLADGAAGRVFDRIRIPLQGQIFQEVLELAKRPHISRYVSTITITPDLSRSSLVREWIAKSMCDGVVLPDALGGLNLRHTGTSRLLQWLYNRGREAGDSVKGVEGYWERHHRYVMDAIDNSYDEKEDQEEERYQLSVLADVFGSLPNLQHVRFDDEYETHDVRALQGSDFWIFDAGTTWRYHIVRTVLEALSLANRRLQSLTVAIHYVETYPAWMINDLRYLLPPQDTCGHDSLRNLRRFHFTGLLTGDDWRPDGFQKSMLSTFELGQLIYHLPMLEDLELHFSGPKPSISFWDLNGSMSKAHKLRKFTLSNIEVDCTELSDYLNTYCRTLELVHMQNVVLSNGHWVKLIEKMRTAKFDHLSSLLIQECFSKGGQGAALFEEDPESHQRWAYELRHSSELVDFVRRRTHKNPWYVRYASWFPHLWR